MKSATGFFSDSDFLFSLCFIYIFNGTPWQFIFFFGTCYVPSVNPGLRGGKLVVAHIKSVCYMPCFFGQRQYLYYTDYIRKLQLNLALLFVSSCFHIFCFTAPAVCFACATCVTSAINSSIMIPPVVSISTSVNLPARPGTNSW